jgi:ATP-dependent DNA ligase
LDQQVFCAVARDGKSFNQNDDRVVSQLDEPIRFLTELEARLPAIIKSVKAHGFEGLVAKNRKSRYEPGQRSGAWQKMRVNQGQELVIGGYTPSRRISTRWSSAITTTTT